MGAAVKDYAAIVTKVSLSLSNFWAENHRFKFYDIEY